MIVQISRKRRVLRIPKLIEGKNCSWLPNRKCRYPISKEVLNFLMKDPEVKDIGETPSMESPMCTNCLLTQILSQLIQKEGDA